jgi:flagellar hook assembly protein FlgD
MDSPVAVGDVGSAPAAFALEEARPNPFNPSTQIAFTLNEPAAARLRILDASGRTVRILAQGAMPAGRQEVHWDGRDGAGRAVSSGVYVAELSVDGRGSERTKLSLIR